MDAAASRVEDASTTGIGAGIRARGTGPFLAASVPCDAFRAVHCFRALPKNPLGGWEDSLASGVSGTLFGSEAMGERYRVRWPRLFAAITNNPQKQEDSK